VFQAAARESNGFQVQILQNVTEPFGAESLREWGLRLGARGSAGAESESNRPGRESSRDRSSASNLKLESFQSESARRPGLVSDRVKLWASGLSLVSSLKLSESLGGQWATMGVSPSSPGPQAPWSL
jgi:hypothetical protein